MSIIGIDEVGRGCWAGPMLVVAAREVLALPAGLRDSKVLTKKRREELMLLIAEACQLGEGWVNPAEIDELGLTGATRLGVQRALSNLEAQTDEVIIMDGNINYCPADFINVSCVIDADALHPIVSAASIYAKVKRDAYMAERSLLYPGYQFEKHVGYGTAAHRAALMELGICELHRLSFKPLQQFAQI
jgi:ribonuclease HII